MLADNPDDGGPFPSDSEEAAAILPDRYTAERIYLDTYPVITDARQHLQESIQQGAVLLNFIGHASLDRLAQEGILLTGDVPSLNNDGKPFIMSAMTCSAGRFEIPGYETLSEALILNKNGGAIAVWAPTGLSINEHATILDKAFFHAVFKENEKILGQSILKSFEAYSDQGPSYLVDIYTLLGDPALKIK